MASIVSQLQLVEFPVECRAEKYKFSAEELAELRRNGVDAVSEREESDLDDFDIEKTDKIILACRSGDIGQIDVVIFDQIDRSFFMHHSVDLPFLPLNVSITNFAPHTKENFPHFIASGFATFSEIFKLNVIDNSAPNFILSQPLQLPREELNQLNGGNAEINKETQYEETEEIEEFEEYEEFEETDEFQRNNKEIAAPDGPQDIILCGDIDITAPNLYVCGSIDGSIYFYNLSDLSVITSIKAHIGGVSNLTLFQQKMITTQFKGTEIAFWNFSVHKEKPISLFSLNYNIESLFSLKTQQKVFITDENGNIYEFTPEGILKHQKKITENILTGLTAAIIKNPHDSKEQLIIATSSPEEQKIFILDEHFNILNIIEDLASYSLLFLNDYYLISGGGTGKINAINIWKRLNPANIQEGKKQKQQFPDRQINLFKGPNDGE